MGRYCCRTLRRSRTLRRMPRRPRLGWQGDHCFTALTLSAVQYTALDGGIAANVPEHIRLIEDAESHGARLVIFPELSLTGYRLDRWRTRGSG